jgi:hypothetical protein
MIFFSTAKHAYVLISTIIICSDIDLKTTNEPRMVRWHVNSNCVPFVSILGSLLVAGKKNTRRPEKENLGIDSQSFSFPCVSP